MISITIIGTGNIATHLFDAFMMYDNLKVIQVVGRSKNSLCYFSSKIDTCLISEKIKKAEIYIIAVSDDSIPEVSNYLQGYDALVVHTSGSVPIINLSKNKKKGVFYPLQSFTKGKKVNFKTIPICIEATNKNDYELLKNIAETISDAVYKISSEQRKHLHLAAVFANNFTNYMYTVANDICEENKISFEILKPLIAETVLKIEKISPFEAQTGPARRNDIETMQRHLEQLTTKEKKNIYKLLSEAIQKKYGKEL
tara:strand:- start:368 stop:1132 length:765 start_codon:yes stop_codon:yes gene_type:complete